MKGIHIPILLFGQQPRGHARPGGEDDKGDEVAKDQGSSDFLESGRGKGVEAVPDEGDGRGDMDHGVCPFRTKPGV